LGKSLFKRALGRSKGSKVEAGPGDKPAERAEYRRIVVDHDTQRVGLRHVKHLDISTDRDFSRA
jgi:hypothetical protein